jgi:hypothetical protein
LQHTSHNLEQGAFACAVRSDDSDAFTFVKMKGNIIERNMSVVADAYMLHIQNGLVGFVVVVCVHIKFRRATAKWSAVKTFSGFAVPLP